MLTVVHSASGVRSKARSLCSRFAFIPVSRSLRAVTSCAKRVQNDWTQPLSVSVVSWERERRNKHENYSVIGDKKKTTPKIADPNILILIMGTPKMVPLIMGTPPQLNRVQDSDWSQSATSLLLLCKGGPVPICKE